jgi:hypothetical protein
VEEAADTFEGLQRFAGKDVRVWADGASEPVTKVSADGVLTLQEKVKILHIGLPVNSVFEPNTRQTPANGTSLAKKKRVEQVTLRLFESTGGIAGDEEGRGETMLTQRFGEYMPGTVPPLFTGDIDLPIGGDVGTEMTIVITHADPSPFTLLAMVTKAALLEA